MQPRCPIAPTGRPRHTLAATRAIPAHCRRDAVADYRVYRALGYSRALALLLILRKLGGA